MLKDFKQFAMKGNMLDLAIAVVIGGAFGKIITSLVNDIIMPLLSLITGRVDFKKLVIVLNMSGKHYKTVDDAITAGVATLNYGAFITSVIDFLIVAFTIFMVIRQLNRFKKKEKHVALKVKECIYCKTNISIEATRCPNCTSQL